MFRCKAFNSVQRVETFPSLQIVFDDHQEKNFSPFFVFFVECSSDRWRHFIGRFFAESAMIASEEEEKEKRVKMMMKKKRLKGEKMGNKRLRERSCLGFQKPLESRLGLWTSCEKMKREWEGRQREEESKRSRESSAMIGETDESVGSIWELER